MPPTFFFARLLGLGAPELLVILVILLVLLSGPALGPRAATDDHRDGLTRNEVRTLIVLGVVLAILGGVLLWPALAH